ncbi:MAG: tRNA (guanosine(46)-N7)-methyltransferase TrmB [Clostridiales Family XIII bacterium]|jgi:tRNA (guanine-N7-)-methyltransferase|nr:tRNA (guanosine(46)-N7)-methyltransferase TrmB [Clostridiales Family XIII bacterium]
MRQRKPKNLQERLDAYKHLLVKAPEQHKGEWRAMFRERAAQRQNAGNAGNAEAGAGTLPQATLGAGTLPQATLGVGAMPRAALATSTLPPATLDVEAMPPAAPEAELYLEIGAGKGRFLTAKAAAAPDSLFLGIEGRDGIVLRALEKAGAMGGANILFSRHLVRSALDIFAHGEIDGLYLNFSDPWPKPRHEAMRLTAAARLDEYKKILKPGGFIEFKTDNKDFFEFTYRKMIEVQGYELAEVSTSLQKSGLPARLVLTEYEERFIRWERDIYFICAIISE